MNNFDIVFNGKACDYTHSRAVYSQHACVQLALCELQDRTSFALQGIYPEHSSKVL